MTPGEWAALLLVGIPFVVIVWSLTIAFSIDIIKSAWNDSK